MKNTLIILIVLFFASPVFAKTWCQWDGSEGVNCQTDYQGYILIDGFPVGSETQKNERGYFEQVIAVPDTTVSQVRDQPVWGHSNNKIYLTWTVRELNPDEIKENTANAMQEDVWWLWFALLETNTITAEQAQAQLPPSIIQAYTARKEIIEAANE